MMILFSTNLATYENMTSLVQIYNYFYYSLHDGGSARVYMTHVVDYSTESPYNNCTTIYPAGATKTFIQIRLLLFIIIYTSSVQKA